MSGVNVRLFCIKSSTAHSPYIVNDETVRKGVKQNVIVQGHCWLPFNRGWGVFSQDILWLREGMSAEGDMQASWPQTEDRNGTHSTFPPPQKTRQDKQKSLHSTCWAENHITQSLIQSRPMKNKITGTKGIYRMSAKCKDFWLTLQN